MNKQIDALKLALEALETGKNHGVAIDVLRRALSEQPAQQQEPVAVKKMMRWVDSLKRLSDNGQHMKIPSELSAGTCWELAIELEQFLKSPPTQREPHGWYIDGYGAVLGTFEPKSVRPGEWLPFYTSPPASKPWVGLTPSEIEAVLREWDYHAGKGGGMKRLVSITEAKLKERNT